MNRIQTCCKCFLVMDKDDVVFGPEKKGYTQMVCPRCKDPEGTFWEGKKKAPVPRGSRASTHWPGCEEVHHACALAQLVKVRAERDALRTVCEMAEREIRSAMYPLTTAEKISEVLRVHKESE